MDKKYLTSMRFLWQEAMRDDGEEVRFRAECAGREYSVVVSGIAYFLASLGDFTERWIMRIPSLEGRLAALAQRKLEQGGAGASGVIRLDIGDL